MTIIIFPVFILCISGVVSADETNFSKMVDNNIPGTEQLRLVSVVFRHGDRAPDAIEMFPKDPNYNNTFFPTGPGGLTNAGKLREFRLGEILRKKYDDFLGNFYLPKSVFARSTDFERTKMCLQLVLAALYPPTNEQVWNQELLWQPIPTTYVPWQLDWLMFPEECPDYLAERKKMEADPELKSKIEGFQEFTRKLTELTGKNISLSYDMYKLYNLFVAESTMNLTLPKWSKDIFPHGKLFDGIQLEFEIFGYTKKMQKLNGGRTLYHMVEAMQKVKNGTMHKNRKVNLYSGHGTNIVAALQVLGVFKPHVPAYSSAVILELVQSNDSYYVKVLYYKGIPETMETMIIPGCELLCPFDKFLDLLKDVIPESHELGCDKTQNF